MNYPNSSNPVTLTTLKKMRDEGRKIVMLTCYDASFAALLERTGVDIALVGDSLGNALQGHPSTLPVTLEQMIYHTECVARGSRRMLIATDMPFGAYQETPQQAMRHAAKLMAAGAQMVKLEGGEYIAETVRFLVERGVPVCAHIGLRPQAVHQLGGYRVQGSDDAAAARLKADALALEQAGAALIVLEMLPAALSREITESLTTMATIGIGAGAHCDGQVLVLYDILGIYHKKSPRFARNFMAGAGSIEEAVVSYGRAVRDGSFPSVEHSY
ncbi:MAG: 3-methyl-2-oxobutanoate hydroxymethyltransferase [Burkholderiales bacterium]|jgi:3-methyl-2-oxobutanoate hydroxymethyltransferase|nr:3-methyl-2-oxobutanoate hydroxymethyltransferase [Burkholderiales bacterium]